MLEREELERLLITRTDMVLAARDDGDTKELTEIARVDAELRRLEDSLLKCFGASFLDYIETDLGDVL